MKKIIKILLIYFCFFTILLVNSVDASTGKVTTKRVRLRKDSSTKAEIITNINKDETVEILGEKDEWYNVKYKSFTGYVSKDYIQLEEVVNDTTLSVSDTTEEQESEKEQVVEESIIGKEYKILKDSKLRLNPNFSSVVLENIVKDTTVKVEKEIGNWIEILVNNKTGWICRKHIEASAEAPIEPVEEQAPEEVKPEEPVEDEKEKDTNEPVETPPAQVEVKKGYINVDTANARESASTSSKRLGFLDLNDEVEILAEEGDWYKVKTKEYGECYIAKRLVSLTKVPSRELEEQRDTTVSQEKNEELNNSLTLGTASSSGKGEQIVEFAKQYLGYKYVSGGKKPETGFDCSGFTRYVFSNFGVSLGATAASQANNTGVEVARADLQVGDLILFQDDGRTRIGHCGIYIGNNTFIHAANPKRGVVTDKLDGNSYYSPRYVSAYRF